MPSRDAARMHDHWLMFPIRLVLAVAAVLMVAWFAVGIRQATDTARATAIVASSSPPTPAAAAQARHLLGSAAWLNPDQTLTLLRGRLALRIGEGRASLRSLEAVVRREPMNFLGWIYLTQAALRYDHSQLERDVRQIQRIYHR